MITHRGELQEGLTTAFIDNTVNSNLAYRPEFVSNDYKQGKKVLASIEAELDRCEEFCISVAFITKGGIIPLQMKLKELEEKGIKGRILTTDYNCFTDPDALKVLAGLSNIELRMFRTDSETGGFHTKGYIFREKQMYRFIIGSSNMTLSAVTKNREWNTKLVSTEHGQLVQDILAEFESFWNDEHTEKYEDFIEDYRREFIAKHETIRQQKLAAREQVVELDRYKLKPNKMQVAFIDNLSRMIDSGVDKALLLSSTGTGKTYASAFAMRHMKYKRVLFLVHRNQIAKQAMKSYRKVFGGSVRMGLVSGSLGSMDYDADFVFATVQTLSKDENLRRFAPDYFDCCIYDEAHHTSAGSYRKVMDYFKPRFTLGMTATPDKRDDNIEGRNIYEIFDHNIAYEIRLQQAMEEDLLCPFHYFGITDIDMVGDSTAGRIAKNDGKETESVKRSEVRLVSGAGAESEMKIGLDAKIKSGMEEFRYLTSDERVRHVMRQAEYYGYSGERVKGLIFCSRVEEAKELSRKFNERGLRTQVLTGSDSEEFRSDAMERLVRDESQDERIASIDRIARGISKPCDEPLDYILSVDIFNEGVDIVEVNQIIMLRPTQSPIVFIQQLGRGLRKANNKEYVVVLDFIGNYNNNFMIPIALSGDRSYNKDNVRKYVLEGGRVIPGSSTIHFDEISRKRIFASIDNANFSDIRLIRESYMNLKNKLGHIPGLQEFDDYGELDVQRIFDNNNLGSYYRFLTKYEKDYQVRLSDAESKVIEFVSKKLANGKRIHELVLLGILMKNRQDCIGKWAEIMKTSYNIDVDRHVCTNVVNLLTNEFPSGAGKKTYDACVFLKKETCRNIETDDFETANVESPARLAAYAAGLTGGGAVDSGRLSYYAARLTDGADYSASDTFAEMLENKTFAEILRELVDFGIHRYMRDYSNTYQDTSFVLYKKYTYEDVCRLLSWEHNEVPLNIGGYKYDKNTKTFPVFINYDKSDDISDTTKYEDHFTGSSSLIAISKSGRTESSEDVQNFLHAKERGIDVHLFVRKNKDDKISKEFYYLGRMTATGRTKEFVMENTDKTAVEIEWMLDTPVREDVYEYIVNG